MDARLLGTNSWAQPRLLLLLLGLLREGSGLRSRPASGTSFSGSLHALSAQQRLQLALPISWVHVPKTGSSIMNAVMGLPGVCLGSPRNVQDRLCSEANPACDAVRFTIEHGIAQRSTMATPKSCPGIARWSWHAGFDKQYQAGHKGHGLIMLRQPEQRLLAGYYNPGDHHGWKPQWGEPASIPAYAKLVQGVGVKSLTRWTDHYSWLGPPSEAETLEAVKRLREGFVFVGITEETELSVCLLHAMFGGECEPWEFGRWHLSKYKNASASWDVSELEGFRDAGDRALFAEAMRIFRENLDLYGASRESCLPCFRRGGVPLEHVARIGQFVEAWDPAM
mmetsp:Transcript_44786/g.139339  ORF Transcript_44786/g.139339 Transcript_44786/m.139339 type:complete len:337 (-) Transcript_44786:43-1053(-)